MGRTAGRIAGAEFGCRLSPTGRVHRHPEPLSPSEDAIDRFRVDSQDRGCRDVDPKCSPGPLWSPLGRHVGFHRPSKARTRCSRMGSVTGCGRRQLIETNECLKNRRLVDVRGVMVLGVAGITEPVEITPGELDLSTIVRAARDSKVRKIRDVSQLTTGLSGCGRSTGGNSIMRSLFRSTGKRRRKRSPLGSGQ